MMQALSEAAQSPYFLRVRNQSIVDIPADVAKLGLLRAVRKQLRRSNSKGSSNSRASADGRSVAETAHFLNL